MAADRFRRGFELEEGCVWLNTADQGRLPRRAARAWPGRCGASPTRSCWPAPTGSPRSLPAAPGAGAGPGSRRGRGRPGHSASCGLHLVANGLGLGPGDGVVVPANDVPSDVLPWLLLRDRGVVVRTIEVL